MITEIAMVLCLTTAIWLKVGTKEQLFKRDFNKLMVTVEKENKYYMNNIKYYKNGYKAIVVIKNGGSFKELSSLKEIIEDCLCCRISMNKKDCSNITIFDIEV